MTIDVMRRTSNLGECTDTVAHLATSPTLRAFLSQKNSHLYKEFEKCALLIVAFGTCVLRFRITLAENGGVKGHHANTWWKPVLPKRGSVVLTSINGNRRSHPYSQATLLSMFPIGVIPAYLKVLSGGIAGSKRIQRAVALKLPLEPKVIKFINVLVPIRCLW